MPTHRIQVTKGGRKIPGLYQQGQQYVFRTSVGGKLKWIPCVEGGVKLDLDEAIQFRHRFLGQEEGERITPSKMTFGELAEIAMDDYRKRESSKRLHEGNLRTHLKAIEGLRVQGIDKWALQRLVVRPMEEKGLSGNTIHNVLMTASVVFERGMDCRPPVVSENPVRRIRAGEEKPKRKSSKTRRVLNGQELRAVVEAPTEKRHQVLLALCGLAGLRISEALAIDWADVQWDAGTLRVHRQLDRARDYAPLKTEASEGHVEMSSVLKRMLAELHLSLGRPTEGRITTGDQRSAQRMMATACKKAGIAEPWPSPHQLRHTFASALISQAADSGDIARVSRQLRHESVDVTLSIYTHEWDAAQKRGRSAADIDATLGAAWGS